ncbi:hypothetical protein BC829DRAFT_223552 [Chytridium lagenaria]|nr:hypothetical protein BC829DRAFT_223552 [Chytridium lagenaria]
MEDVQEALEVASNISSDDADSTNDSRFQPFRPPGTKFFPNSSLRHPIRKDGFAHIRKLEPPNEVLNQFDEDDQDMAVEVSLKPTELPNSDRNELAICRTASHMTPDDLRNLTHNLVNPRLPNSPKPQRIPRV